MRGRTVAELASEAERDSGAVEARAVWGAHSDVFMVLREPTPPFEAHATEDPLVAVLVAVDEDGRETGEVAGVEIVGLLELEEWDGIPEVPGLWRLPGREPEPFVELLKGEQRELRRAYRERGAQRRAGVAPAEAEAGFSRTDHDLELLTAVVVVDLPEVAGMWSELHEEARFIFEQEWRNDLGGLEALERHHAEGRMSPSQEGRYRDLKAALRARLPIVEKLGLEMPAVPLDEVGPAPNAGQA